MQNTLERYLTAYFRQKHKFDVNALRFMKFKMIERINRLCCTSETNVEPTCCNFFRNGDVSRLLYQIEFSNAKQLRSAMKIMLKLLKEDPCCV